MINAVDERQSLLKSTNVCYHTKIESGQIDLTNWLKSTNVCYHTKIHRCLKAKD